MQCFSLQRGRDRNDMKCFSLQRGRDRNGAAIALFTARIHQPSLTTHQLVLKALVYQLDAALERLV
jgi:tyrosine-protein phosphatase non-receptor type 9